MRVDLSPAELRILAAGLRILATRRDALQKLTRSQWRAMLRAANKLDAAVARRRARE